MTVFICLFIYIYISILLSSLAVWHCHSFVYKLFDHFKVIIVIACFLDHHVHRCFVNMLMWYFNFGLINLSLKVTKMDALLSKQL